MKKLLYILCAFTGILTLSGCGLLSYTPQERNIKTTMSILGCTWTWESTARGWQPPAGTGVAVDAAAAAESAKAAVLAAKLAEAK